MRVLVVGGGGREHAICRALMSASPQPQLFVAPGNAGTEGCSRNVQLAADDVAGLVEFARDAGIDLVVAGAEAALVAGLRDALDAAGIACCGPTRAAAALEGSKRFTREIAAKAGVPSPDFRVVQSEEALADAVGSFAEVPVVKADGLAAGKGVFLPDSREEAVAVGRRLLGGELGDAGKTVVLEQRLSGVEASLFYACNGTEAVMLPHARDHKRLRDGDQGPNTGGMGAVSPNPALDDAVVARVTSEIVAPTLRAMVEAGTPFSGFLFAGVMLTPEGPRLLEFNVRLGDPEAQAILKRLAPGQLLELARAVARGELGGFELRTDPRPTCAVVMAAEGYPEAPRKGDAIEVATGFYNDDRWLDHAGTATRDGVLLTAGGRVAAVVARGDTAEAARKRAYEGVEMVSFRGKHVRTDIGAPHTEERE